MQSKPISLPLPPPPSPHPPLPAQVLCRVIWQFFSFFCLLCNYSHSTDTEIWKCSKRSVCNKMVLLLYVSLTLTGLFFFSHKRGCLRLFSSLIDQEWERGTDVYCIKQWYNTVLLVTDLRMYCAVLHLSANLQEGTRFSQYLSRSLGTSQARSLIA